MGKIIGYSILAIILLIALFAVVTGALIGGGGGSRQSNLTTLGTGTNSQLTQLKRDAELNLGILVDALFEFIKQTDESVTRQQVQTNLSKAIETKGEQAFLLSGLSVTARGGWGTILTEFFDNDAQKAGKAKQFTIDKGFKVELPPPQLVAQEIREVLADTGYFGAGFLYQQENITAAQLDDFIKKKAGSRQSVMVGTGAQILEVAAQYHLNPVYILAHGGHESAWGTSRIALAKNNLFGYGAYDSCPFECAKSFPSIKEGLQFIISRIKKNYLTSGGKYYRGETLEAMNVNYATDKQWAAKIKQIMTEFYRHVGKTPEF
ncbi:glucosaminidase domain-containing protein [Candidatus Berkelbacteria bacterium]|nr:glucosaminidase domain-containing protein [Candidatus Berkelbacteria bacterium]